MFRSCRQKDTTAEPVAGPRIDAAYEPPVEVEQIAALCLNDASLEFILLHTQVLSLPRPNSTGETLNMNVIDAGEGPTILLLHGFPDSAKLWFNQIPVLVKAGYRVIAPDLRGFGDTDKPQQVADYDYTELITDLVVMLFAVSAPMQLAAIVGHDIGISLGLFFASMNGGYEGVPFHTQCFVMICGGHTNLEAKFADVGDNMLRQRQLSWYTMFFNQVGVAENGISANDFEWLRRVWEPKTPKAIVQQHVTGLSRAVGDIEHGALTAALNWFRSPSTGVTFESFCMPSAAPAERTLPKIPVATLSIWAEFDPYVTKEWMAESAKHVKDGLHTLETIKCGHWAPLEKPQILSDMLLKFIPKPQASSTKLTRNTKPALVDAPKAELKTTLRSDDASSTKPLGADLLGATTHEAVAADEPLSASSTHATAAETATL